MKPFGNSENLGALISICRQPDDVERRKNLKNDYVYSREFQAMLDSLDEEDSTEEARQATEKKRRLSMEQVKALEKSFEVDNKLEPERKLKLAQELGLQPRQVAIWFQNRRARWKTKQLERDYGLLKANYDALKQDLGYLEQEKEALTEELRALKGKLGEENAEGNHSGKEESPEPNHGKEGKNARGHLGDSSSNVDSNGVLLEGSNASAQLLSSQYDTSFLHLTGLSSCSSSSSRWTMNWFQASDSKAIPNRLLYHQNQGVKMEDQNLFVSDGSCNFFSVEEQAPSMHWYLPQQRSEF